MHVALFSDTFAPQVNGAANVVRNIARELVKSGHEVTVASVKAPGSLEVDQEARTDGYRVVRYASAELPSYKDARVAVPTVLKSVRWGIKSRPDIIHVHTNFGIGWEGVALSKVLGVPLIGTHHTFLDDYRAYGKMDARVFNPLVRRFVSSFFNRCQVVTSPSKALEKDLRKSGVTVPVIIVPNPVDTALFAEGRNMREQGREELGIKGRAIIFFGRLGYEKSMDVLISAVVPLLNKRKDLTLIITGDGPDRIKLQRHVNELGLVRRIIFTGMLTGTTLARTVASADIFASASLSENQPISVIEANAAGLPAVVFDARGMPEIVSETNGRVVPTGNTAAFTAALDSLLTDDALRQELSAGAQNASGAFNADSVVEGLLKQYQRLLP